MLQDHVDLARTVEPVTTAILRDTVEGLHHRTFLHPPDVALDLRPLHHQWSEVLLGASNEKQPQARLVYTRQTPVQQPKYAATANHKARSS